MASVGVGVIRSSTLVRERERDLWRESLDIVGAVSREVAEALACGVRERFGTSLAVAVTGIAGPDADGSTKPVGLTYIAVASETRTSSREFKFDGDRASNRRQAANEALRMLIAEVRSVRQVAS